MMVNDKPQYTPRRAPGRGSLIFLGSAARVAMLALVLAAGLLAGSNAALGADDAPVPAASVNINTADAATLASSLKGVGEARAREIVRYRETYGPFSTVDELLEVKGVGQSTLDMNRRVITLE